MLEYCFVEEDIRDLPEQDPLMLQYRYAQRLNRALVCRLEQSRVCERERDLPELRGRRVMLRATCETADEAMGLLDRLGACLLENSEDLQRVREWDRLGLTERTVFPLRVSDLKTDGLWKSLPQELRDAGELFLKTRDKGFSLHISRERFFSGDLRGLTERYCPSGSEELMLAPWYPVRSDSLGSMEARFFILEGRICNASRPVHSVRHAVPRSLRDGASAVLDKVLRDPLFPRSFVLDMGMFRYPDGVRADIVEINPLTTAMCYISNTVFDELTEECRQIYARTGWGYEYCLDYLSHPGSYSLDRDAARSYSYDSDSRYELL